MLDEKDRLGDWIHAADMRYFMGSNCDMEFRTIHERETASINKACSESNCEPMNL